MAPPAVARAKLDEYGIDAVCDAITGGTTLKAICKQVDVQIGSFIAWLEADADRSARVWDARRMAAWLYDEQAEAGLKAAKTMEQINRARELASHYRWRASKLNPRYADRVDVNHTGTITLEALITRSMEPAIQQASAPTIQHDPDDAER